MVVKVVAEVAVRRQSRLLVEERSRKGGRRGGEEKRKEGGGRRRRLPRLGFWILRVLSFPFFVNPFCLPEECFKKKDLVKTPGQ
jgi:hypothetical protein